MLGMAVRSGYALGLHRKQAALAFTVPEQLIRYVVVRYAANPYTLFD